jgi:Ham1 family
MRLVFLDANDLRTAEVHRIAPTLDLVPGALPSGYAAAGTDPTERARGHVLAYHGDGACLADATDLLTMEGRSLRLELDSENERRFCRWFRQTPVRLHLCVALRRGAGADVEVFTATCDGRVADKPAGPDELGWDHLFVPDGHELTLAQLVARGDAVGPRQEAYAALARAVATPTG